MEIVKKNALNIVWAAIALVAFIAWFWPVGGWYDTLGATLKKRVEVDGKVKSLMTKPRPVPALNPDAIAKPETLTHFPNAVTIKTVQAASDRLKQNSDDALRYVVALNRQGHDLLVPGLLPLLQDNNLSFLFRSQYNAMMDYGGKPEPWNHLKPEQGPLNLLDQVLNATKVAAADEVTDAKRKKWEADYVPRIFIKNGQPDPITRQEVETEFLKDTANFDKEFHQKRASQFKVYCEPDAMTRAPALAPGDNTPNATDVWFAQMTLWVEQDVCQTIRDMNKDVVVNDGPGIAMSPVKNLIEVTINPNFQMYLLGQQSNPAAPLPELEPSDKKFLLSPTGRVCNTRYDVVKFHVTAVVDARHVQDFLEYLRYRRLVTVTTMFVQEQDPKAAEQQGYIYGASRCVQVSLDCEELFMRDWTVRQLDANPNLPAPPMPLAVQALLGIPPPATPAPGTTPPPTAGNKVAMQ